MAAFFPAEVIQQQQQQVPLQSSWPVGSPRPQPRSLGNQPQYSIAAIKEDPDMADDEVLASRNLTKLQQCLTDHRLRLSIAATDLIGKSVSTKSKCLFVKVQTCFWNHTYRRVLS